MCGIFIYIVVTDINMDHTQETIKSDESKKKTFDSKKSIDYSFKLDLIIILISLLIILTSILFYDLRNISTTLLINDSFENKPMKSNNSSKPKVWIIGRKMESGYLKHVIEIFERISYQLVNGSETEWDVLWSHDYPFSKSFFETLKPHQKVNHFPGSGYITNKVSLATSNIQHIPRAFHLPKDKQKFLQYAREHSELLWVKKSNDHRGIKVENIDQMDLDSKGMFVQEYIQNPLLIDGKKFDIGIYVTLTSIDPLRVYVYDSDVLLRFCARHYYPFNSTDIDSYVVGDDYTPIWDIPSLKKYFIGLNYNMKQTLNIYLRSIGKDPNPMWKKIEEAIANVYIAKEDLMVKLAAHTFSSTRNFFELVRFDFLADEDLNVYLLEANMSPNLSSLHFASNKLLYEQVIFNLFSLIGLTRIDGINKWTDLDRNYWNMRVSDKDLTINETLCSSAQCYLTCVHDFCKSCLACLDNEFKIILKDAYLEHNSRWNQKRLIPKTSENFNPTGIKNQIQIDWFKGKCAQDIRWCN